MRPWMIVLSSAIAAIVIASALAIPELLNASRSELGPMLLPHVPALMITALALYALCAMVLTVATLISGILRVRQYLTRNTAERALPRRDWLAAFGANGFRQLAPKLAPTLAQSARGNGGFVFQTHFDPNETRREIARLHYISLARTHFFSALIALAGLVGLGLAQDHGSLPFLSGAIPTISAILILVGLALLAVLSRIAVDVTAEPLLETICQLPTERVEIGLLRRAVELLEVVCDAPAVGDRKAPASPAQLPERLVDVVEQGHHALLDAVGRLSANTQGLGATLQSSIESLDTTMRAAAAQPPPIQEYKITDAAMFPELQAAVEELTAVLHRLSALPEEAEGPPLAADPGPRRKASAPRLARELQRLLQEIEAGR